MGLAPGVWWIGIPLGLMIVPALIVSPWLGLTVFALFLGVLAFYRDPNRTTPPQGVVAPADGKVSVIRREGDRLRVGIFMNIFDVHVNRAPLPGTVESVAHTPGAHRPAFSKESDRNERVRITCTDSEYIVVLIAGAFARRITPYVEPGATVARGERIGHISFGSRVDVLLPPSIEHPDLRVEQGDQTKAGETVIAREPTPVEFDS